MLLNQDYKLLPLMRDKMLKVLGKAQKDRQSRPIMIEIQAWWDESKTDRVPEWNVYEVDKMLNAVNSERMERDLPKLTVNDLRRTERMAVGHVDYTTKFALYCAELALGYNDIQS